ncbi:MAG: hypothetical protein IT444_09815 [Phycisphaeraceae bacterium]|nr:hypothetical protein [Phycisphaeraceae bacterium]
MAAPADKPNAPPQQAESATAQPPFPRLATAVLLHHAPDGDHYDWLIEDPRQFGAINPLWTARAADPPASWRSLRQWSLEIIANHRRDYLTYQGELTNNRGSVVRVDQGTCDATAWESDNIKLIVCLQSFQGRVWLTPNLGSMWTARLMDEATGS